MRRGNARLRVPSTTRSRSQSMYFVPACSYQELSFHVSPPQLSSFLSKHSPPPIATTRVQQWHLRPWERGHETPEKSVSAGAFRTASKSSKTVTNSQLQNPSPVPPSRPSEHDGRLERLSKMKRILRQSRPTTLRIRKITNPAAILRTKTGRDAPRSPPLSRTVRSPHCCSQILLTNIFSQ
jgi:hypothetical protein